MFKTCYNNQLIMFHFISKCLTILTYIEETESPNTEFPGTSTVTPYDQTTVTGIETPLTTVTSGT